MKNEYGDPLDKNGYAASIIPHTTGCYRCGYLGDLARHEIFGGRGRREKSKRLGLWVLLCPTCHFIVHCDEEVSNLLHQHGEMRARDVYRWSKEDFIREFGISYLED